MARNLEELRKRYNSIDRGQQRRAMPMGHGPRGPRRDMGMGGKPKEMKRTIKRLLSYVGKHKMKLALVCLCMLVTAVTSLVGSYMIAPIVDRIALELFPDANIEMSAAEKAVDKIIVSITNIEFVQSFIGVKLAAVSFTYWLQ